MLRPAAALWSAATVLVIALMTSGSAIAAPEPIVIGQSLALGASDDGNGRRVVEGTRAYIEAINAKGGINGRPVKLVTLDNGNDPVRQARNLRQLVTEERAVALLNCLGEVMCQVAAIAAGELRVPLIGPMAAGRQLSQGSNPFVFRVRASFDKEAAALARQLRSVAAFDVVIVSDQPPAAERTATLKQAFEQGGLKATVMVVDKASTASFELALRSLGAHRFQATVLELGAQSIDTLVANGLERREEWPLVVAMASTDGLNPVMNAFKGRLIGFTAVVPNPDSGNLPLTREFQANVDKYAEGAAATYAGFEAYINTRICIEALRRAGPNPQPGRVVMALEAMTDVDLGGFAVSFRKDRASGSDYVDIGVRSRSGNLLR